MTTYAIAITDAEREAWGMAWACEALELYHGVPDIVAVYPAVWPLNTADVRVMCEAVGERTRFYTVMLAGQDYSIGTYDVQRAIVLARELALGDIRICPVD